MTDYTELRRLAEAALAAEADDVDRSDRFVAQSNYESATRPLTLLALLDRLEKAENMVQRLSSAAAAISLGRSVHNDRFPDRRLDGPLWSSLNEVISAARSHIEETRR